MRSDGTLAKVPSAGGTGVVIDVVELDFPAVFSHDCEIGSNNEARRRKPHIPPYRFDLPAPSLESADYMPSALQIPRTGVTSNILPTGPVGG